MTAITLNQKSILLGWFNRQVSANNQDSQAYDFNAELDSSLTYSENKAKFKTMLGGVAKEDISQRIVKAIDDRADEYNKAQQGLNHHRHIWKQSKQDRKDGVKRCKIKGCKELRQRD